MADERREPEDGQRLPARRVEDGRRHRPPGRGPPQGRDALAVRRPGGDRRGYRKGHTYPTVVRRTDPKGQLYRSWRLEEPLRLLGLSLDRAGGELNRWVFRASHSRIPEIVELSKKKSGDAAPTSHAPSNRAAPTPGSRRSTTGSRPPSAWPTASTASPTSSPWSCPDAADSTSDCHNPQSNPQNIRSLREDHRDPWGRWKGAVMSERTCNIARCHNPAESSGLCAHHFTRALVYGQLRVANHAASLSGAVPRGEA